MKNILVAVTNDLIADQRVNKVCLTLLSLNAEVKLIGIQRKKSIPMNDRSYKTHRMKLFSKNGPLFYAEYNIRLFFYLLFNKCNLIVSNDLDTLPACYLAAKIKIIPIVYDSHEFFTDVPELVGNKFAKNVWLFFEKKILPKLKYCYTVCESIAKEYNRLYKTNMEVVRNVPLRMNPEFDSNFDHPALAEMDKTKKIILYQGALNVGRGLEQTIQAMNYLNDCILVIIGEGDLSIQLRNQVVEQKMQTKVFFLGKLHFGELKKITHKATLGLVLQEDCGLSYHYVLPNRIFDYIQSHVPVLVSELPELMKIMNDYKVGMTIPNLNPKIIADTIQLLINSQNAYESYKNQCKLAANILNWEIESKKLIKLYQSIPGFLQ